MTTTLFPPVVETYIPAFLISSGRCRVYFNFSQFNTINDIAGVHLIVRNQYSNKNELNASYTAEMVYYSKDDIVPVDNSLNKYYIELNKNSLISGFQINESYKVQLRFIDKDTNVYIDNNGTAPDQSSGYPNWINENLQNFSEWSTVGLIRGISTPTLVLNNFKPNEEAIYKDLSLVLSGNLSFDVKEKDSLQSYVVTLSSGGKLIEKSEKVYTSSLNPNTIYYEFKKLLESGGEYTLKFEYTTRAKYQSSATYYLTVTRPEIKLPKDIKFTIDPNQERGSVFLSIEGLQLIAADNKYESLISDDTIHLRVRRTSSKSDFTIWETMQEIVLYLKDFNAFRWEDCTVESGVWYRYGFLLVSDIPGTEIKYSQFFTYGDLKGSNKEDYIFCPFEDMFLVDKKSNLRIQFNQSVDSMKYVQTESIVTTLGSKYPYVIKGGNTKYRQFNISGMISILEDIEGIQSCACGPDSQKQEFKTDYSNIFFKKSSTIFKELFNNNEDQKISLYDDYKTAYNISPNNDYVIEKLFRDKVMEFLTDNDVKLFKTMTEGNILVKLTNVSFTPNKTLGRNIYSFSATATEIAEDSVDNYNKFNIVRTDLQTGHFEYMLILPQVPQGSIQKDDKKVEYDIKTKTAEISRGYGNRISYMDYPILGTYKIGTALTSTELIDFVRNNFDDISDANHASNRYYMIALLEFDEEGQARVYGVGNANEQKYNSFFVRALSSSKIFMSMPGIDWPVFMDGSHKRKMNFYYRADGSFDYETGDGQKVTTSLYLNQGNFSKFQNTEKYIVIVPTGQSNNSEPFMTTLCSGTISDYKEPGFRLIPMWVFDEEE